MLQSLVSRSFRLDIERRDALEMLDDVTFMLRNYGVTPTALIRAISVNLP